MKNPVNLLHTYSKWIYKFHPKFPEIDATEEIESKIKFLKKKEEAFYIEFSNGVAKDYGSFLNYIKNIFANKDSKGDIDEKILQKFSNASLRHELLQLESKQIRKNAQKYQLRIKVDNLSKSQIRSANQRLAKKGIQANHNKEENFISIPEIGLNADLLKNIANAMYNTKLKPGTNSTKKLMEIIKDSADSFMLLDENSNEIRESFEEVVYTDVSAFPWGFNANLIKKALEGDMYLQEGIKNAIQVVYDFLMRLCKKGSPALRKAFRISWQQKMGEGDEQISNFLFFSKGKNFINGVIGALGEFQALILINYLKLKNNNKKISGEILGDKEGKTKGEQGKTDILASNDISSWGIQVKNYNHYNTQDYFNTNLHPKEFGENFNAENNGIKLNLDEFYTFIANYFFNRSYQIDAEGDFLKFLSFLDKEIAYILNLTTSESVEDTVVFYWISGMTLLPGSIILEKYLETIEQIGQKKLKILKPIYINSSFEGMNDEQFHTKPRDDNGNLLERPYTKYWSGKFGEEDSWIPQDLNKKTFNNLISKDITIQSGIYYKNLTTTVLKDSRGKDYKQFKKSMIAFNNIYTKVENFRYT